VKAVLTVRGMGMLPVIHKVADSVSCASYSQGEVNLTMPTIKRPSPSNDFGLRKPRDFAGYWAPVFDQRDHYWKARHELEAAEVLQRFLVRAGESIEGLLSVAPQAPPDIVLTTDRGNRIGIEITEIFSGLTLELITRSGIPRSDAPYTCVNWTAPMLADTICRRIAQKDQKLSSAKTLCDEYRLAITTDETMIVPSVARDAIAMCRPSSARVRRAYLILNYHPETDATVYPDQCLVLEIPLT